jgi:hypothetical protein
MKKLLMTTLILASAPMTALAGTHFTAVTTTVIEGKKPQQYTVESWVEGPKARMVFKGSTEQAGIPKGSYIITTDGARTLYMVNPKDKTYSRWDIDAILKSAGAALNAVGGMVKMEVENQDVKAQPPTAGPPMHGLPTTHYVFDTSYDLIVKVFGMKHGQHVVSHEELWTTTALKDPGFAAWLRKRPPKTGNTTIDELVAAAFHDVKGMLLKQVVDTTTADRKGHTSGTKNTMEVVSLEKAGVNDSMFQIPAGYREVEPQAAAASQQQPPEQQEQHKGKPSLKSILGAFGGGK